MNIEKFATGMWYVFADNGQRLGTLTGGKGIYGAEHGTKHLGYFGTLQLAGEEVCKAAGKVDIVKQMENIIASTNVLQHYKSDFEIDKEIALNFRCSLDMIWVVRPMGTHLIPLGLPRTSEELMAVYECYRREPHDRFLCFVIDAKAMKIKPIAFEELSAFAKIPPAWNFDGNIVKLNNVPKGRIETINGTMFGRFGEKPQGGVEIHCNFLPSAGEKSVLIALAHNYAVKTTQSLFVKLDDVRLMYDDKLIYSTKREYERQKKLDLKKAQSEQKETKVVAEVE